jgi:prepilin-type N-terminal cleavage/methylation domain-containing protein
MTPKNGQRRFKRATQAVTLIELLVVIAVLAILAALFVPSLSGMRERANRGKCISNMRQVLAAASVYVGEHNGNYWDGRRENLGVVPSQLNKAAFNELKVHSGGEACWACPSYLKATLYKTLPVPNPTAGFILGYSLWVGMPASSAHQWMNDSPKNAIAQGARHVVVTCPNVAGDAGVTTLSHGPAGPVRVGKKLSLQDIQRDYPAAVAHIGYSDGSIETRSVRDMSLYRALGADHFR